jgi:glycosyltransferase involved in cell wall biosynthesis
VLGDLPSLREIWGEAALYAPPDDHAGLKAALDRLIDDPGLLRHMSHCAREVALWHTGAAMADAYAAAYRQPASARGLRQAAGFAQAIDAGEPEEKQCMS